MGMAEEEFDEIMCIPDEQEDYDTSAGKRFYLLRERTEGCQDRIKPVRLSAYLPIDEIRRNFLQNLTDEAYLIPVEGTYFPDFLEENGVYFVSLALLEYLKEKIAVEPLVANGVCFIGEGGKRLEEYFLITPEAVDCVLAGSERMDKSGFLSHFELDQDKVGDLDIFKVNRFSQLIVTERLAVAGFTGVECVRLENAFDYEGERDRIFLERLAGQKLAAAIKVYETKADATGDINYKFGLQRVFDKYAIQKEISDGFKRVLAGHTGELFAAELLADRFLMFFWSWRTRRIQLAGSHASFFAEPGFTLTKMEIVRSFVEKLPKELIPLAKHVCGEYLLYYAAIELPNLFSRYPAIHGETRFRIYLHDTASSSMNPPLICDYKRPLQCQTEQASSLRGPDLSHQDLREFDLSGKNLTELVIEGSDLRRTKFHGATLNRVTFKNCNLLGAEFSKAALTGAKFVGCSLERARFEGAALQETVFQDSDLWHCKFIQCNLAKASFYRPDLAQAYFYACQMPEAVFAIPGIIYETAFSLCQLTRARFLGNLANPDNILSDCNFSNADLTEAKFTFDMIACCKFVKSKLLSADFSQSSSLSASDFSWANLTLAALPKAIDDCTFYAVDLSRLKQKHGTIFAGCDFTHANLSGYDFSVGGYRWGNTMRETNLTGSNLQAADFTTSRLRQVNFVGANLKEAKFKKEQLEHSGLSTMQQQEVGVIREGTEENELPEIVVKGD